MPRIIPLLGLLLGSLALTGCQNRVAQRVTNEGDTRRLENDLKAIHLMCLASEAANKRPPAKADDLAAVKDKDTALYGVAFERFKQGEYVVRWQLFNKDNPGALPAQEVLAYATKAASDGTHVILMGDGSVQRVDAAKFASLKKD